MKNNVSFTYSTTLRISIWVTPLKSNSDKMFWWRLTPTLCRSKVKTEYRCMTRHVDNWFEFKKERGKCPVNPCKTKEQGRKNILVGSSKHS